ncbi:MAG: hypothetical protein A2152_03040 [Candidatus Levybacteria bacterium RBG_16_35_6]|nr:MAG: hypothetical protein A2152_03040 [Candidatus Levybacteria bacterium RBG_16_35_6]
MISKVVSQNISVSIRVGKKFLLLLTFSILFVLRGFTNFILSSADLKGKLVNGIVFNIRITY